MRHSAAITPSLIGHFALPKDIALEDECDFCEDCGACLIHSDCVCEESSFAYYDDIADIIPQSEEEIIAPLQFIGFTTCNLFGAFARDISVWFLSLGSLFAQDGRAKVRHKIASKMEADLELFQTGAE